MEAEQRPERAGPDGLVRRFVSLGGFWFEVAWNAEKRAKIVRQRGVDLLDAIYILDDPGHAIEPQGPPYEGQYRIVGLDRLGRLITMAASISYPGESVGGDTLGLLRVYTCWRATAAERAFRGP